MSSAHTKGGVENHDLIPKAKLKLDEKIGPISVWLVDGDFIRTWIFIDFTEGGNTEAYPWMPPNEIWLDNENKSENGFILLHELHEFNRMRNDGLVYEKAHISANVVEKEARRDPKKLKGLMDDERNKTKGIEAKTPGHVLKK